jgi:hypothetical protein
MRRTALPRPLAAERGESLGYSFFCSCFSSLFIYRIDATPSGLLLLICSVSQLFMSNNFDYNIQKMLKMQMAISKAKVLLRDSLLPIFSQNKENILRIGISKEDIFYKNK